MYSALEWKTCFKHVTYSVLEDLNSLSVVRGSAESCSTKMLIVHSWWHSPWSRWVLLLKRGNVLCIDQKLSGFVISGAAVPPTSKESQCSWTTHQSLFTEEKGTLEVVEIHCSHSLDILDW